MKLNKITRAKPIPSRLCFPRRPEQLEVGEAVYVIEELPGDRLRVMTLAGQMIVKKSDTDWKGEGR